MNSVFKQLLDDSGVSLKKASADVVQYMQLRSTQLQKLGDDPDLKAATLAEAKNVFTYAMEDSVDLADEQQARLWNLLLGGLAASAL